MKPSTKRIIVYFIASVFFTLLIEYFTHALTFGIGLLSFGCIFVCCLINELCFFYLPKKWFGEDVDKPVKNESGLPEWKIKLMVAAIALAAIAIAVFIIVFVPADIDTILKYMFAGFLVFSVIMAVLKIKA